MDGIVDYFDYNNYENGEWTNTLSNGNEMTIYGTPTIEDNAVVLDNVTNNNYATLPIDNSTNSIIYMVSKFNGRYNDRNNRLYEIPYSISYFPTQTPLVTINSGNIIAYGAFNNDKNTSISGLDYHVTTLIIDKSSNKLKFYVDGNYISELTFNGNYGNIIYLAKSNHANGENGNNSYKMIAVGNTLQSEEEIIENSNYLYNKYVEGLPVDNTNPLVSIFGYTGNYQTFTAPVDGTYKIETWGAQGGSTSFEGGKGAYATGSINLQKDDILYIYVGSNNEYRSGYNGGGVSISNSWSGGGGGGATDVRLNNGLWDDTTSLSSRIMVAAGGGGAAYYSYGNGGAGGTLTGIEGKIDDRLDSSYESPKGGTQTSGGSYGSCGPGYCEGLSDGTFGKGGNVGTSVGYTGGGGGGGYYGGGGGASGYSYSGAGGSSYISGYLGSVAITAEDNLSPRSDSNGASCTDESALTDITCSYHYSGKKFTETVMKSGNENMPTPNGTSTMKGNSGNGFAKITILDYEGELPDEDVVEKPIKPTKPTIKTNGYSVDDYVSDNLLAHYDGITNDKNFNILKDISGNNHNGTIYNGSWGNNGLKFNGSNSYVQINNNITNTALTSESVEVIFKFNAEISRGVLYCGGSNERICLSVYDGAIIVANRSTYSTFALPSDMFDGKIKSLVATYNNGNYSLYYNNETLTKNSSNNYVNSNGTTSYIGSRNTSYYYNGEIYNVKVYDKTLTEEELSQNFNVNKQRYGVGKSYLTSNTSSGTVSSTSESEDVYKLFDNDKTTTYSSDLTEEIINWNMLDELTIKSLKIYGSSNSSKYPTTISFEGSKDGETYDIIIDERILESKGLNEYNEIIIPEEGKQMDSYKYYRWTLKNEKGIELNEIELETYDIIRTIYDDTKEIGNVISNYNYSYTRTDTSSYYNYMKQSNEKIEFSSRYKDNLSVLYYKDKLGVGNLSPLKVKGLIGLYNTFINNASGGTARIGFSKTNNPSMDDFEEYIDFDIKNRNNEVTHDFKLSISEPGNYYFKIVLSNTYTNAYDANGVIANLYNLSFNDAPLQTYVESSNVELTGNIINTVNSGILNEEDAYLSIDNVIINVNKQGTSSSYVYGIDNYGTLNLSENTIINVNANYTNGIRNRVSGVLEDFDGANINITSSTSDYSYGIRNFSTKNNNKISNLNINITSTSNSENIGGIYDSTDLSIENTNIIGNYNSSSNQIGIKGTKGVVINLDNVYLNVGYGIKDDSNANVEYNINNSIIDAIKTGIYVYGYKSKIINNKSASNVKINNSIIDCGYLSSCVGISSSAANIELTNNTIKGYSNTLITTTGDTYFKMNSGLIDGYKESIHVNGESTFDFINGKITSANYATIYSEATYATIKINVKNDFILENTGGYAIFENKWFSCDNEITLQDNAKIVSTGYGIYERGSTKFTINLFDNSSITADSAIYIDSLSSDKESIINIGSKDGIVKTDYPKIDANNLGINSLGLLNLYDGQIISQTKKQIIGIVNDSEPDYDLHFDTIDTNKEKLTLQKVSTSGEAVARVDSTNYNSLQAAFNAVNGMDTSEEKTIILLKDLYTINGNIIVNENKKVKLDINNNKLRYYKYSKNVDDPNHEPLIKNYGDLSLSNNNTSTGEIYMSNGTIVDNYNVLNLGTINLNTDINNKNYMAYQDFIHDFNNSKLTIDGTKLSDTGFNHDSKIIRHDSTSDFLIKNAICDRCKIYNNGNFVIENITMNSTNNITNSENGEFKIEDATIKNSQIDNYGKTNIVNATFSSSSNIYNYGPYDLNIGYDSNETYDENSVMNDNLILNGTNIYNSGSGTINIANVKTTSGTRTIENKSDGTINIYGASYLLDALINSGSGTLNVYSGTVITSNVIAISNSVNGIVNIYSGTVIISNTIAISNSVNGIVNIGTKATSEELANDIGVSTTNPYIKSTKNYAIYNEGTMNFYDGILVSLYSSVLTTASNQFNSLEEGYMIENGTEGSLYTKYLSKPVIAKVGDVNFYSLESAIESDECSSSCTIEMQREPTLFTTSPTIVINSDQDITINLNDVSLDIYNEKFITNNGKLTINGEVENDIYSSTITVNQVEFIENNGELVLNSVKINSIGVEKNSYNSSLDNLITKKSVIINNKSLKITDSNISSNTLGIINNDTATTFDIDDSTISGTYNTIINVADIDVNIKNSNILQAVSIRHEYGAIIHKYGTLKIDGGSFKSSSCYNGCTDFIIHNMANVEIINNPTFISANKGIKNDNLINDNNEVIPGTVYIESVTAMSGDYFIYNLANKIENQDNIVIDNIKSYGTKDNRDFYSGAIVDNKSNGSILINKFDIISYGYSSYSELFYNESNGDITLIDGTIDVEGIVVIKNIGTGNINIGRETDTYTNSPSIISKKNRVLVNTSTGNINFYNGEIIGPIDDIYQGKINLRNGYTIQTESYNDSDTLDKKTLVIDNFVEVNSTGYMTITDALNSSNCSSSCEIKLLKDIDILASEDVINIESTKNITIDLNGHKIFDGFDKIFNIDSTYDENTSQTIKATLKIYDSSGNKDNAYLVSNAGSSWSSIKSLITNNGNLTLEDIKLKTTDYSHILYNDSDGTTTEIKNCYFDSRNDYSSIYDIYNNSGIINLKDTHVYSNASSIYNAGLINIYGYDIEKKLVNSGTVNVYASTTNYQATSTNSSIENSGTFTLESGKITGDSSSMIVNNSTGTMNINGGEVEDTKDSSSDDACMFENNGTLLIAEGTFTTSTNSIIYNKKNLTVSNGTYNAKYNSITNSSGGTSNVSGIVLNKGTSGIINRGGTNSVINVNNINISCYSYEDPVTHEVIKSCPETGISNLSTGTINLTENITINASLAGVVNSGGGTVNIGIENANPSTTDPYIFGGEYGVNNSNGTVNFYDGKVIGLSPNQSITATPLSGYKINKVLGTGDLDGYEIATLSEENTVAWLMSLNGTNVNDLETAINSTIPGGYNTLELLGDVEINKDLTLPDNTELNIITGVYKINGIKSSSNPDGYTISGNNVKVYYNGDENNSLLATIRDLLSLGNIKIRKNIVVYNDDTGNKLNAAEEYILKYKTDSGYEQIDVEEDKSSVGKYIVSTTTSDDIIRSYNGNVILQNIPEGEYILEGDLGSTSTFTINEDGSLNGNVRTSYVTDTFKSNVLASSEADMIVNIQTGNKVIRYSLIMLGLMSIISILLIIRKKARN